MTRPGPIVRMPRLARRLATFLALVGVCAVVSAQAPWPDESAVAVPTRLIADVSGWQPGSTFTVALVAEVPSGWHVYWRNSGDAGLPPDFAWELPDGFRVTPLEWPIPETFRDHGIVTYGYSGTVTWLFSLTCPEAADSVDAITLDLTVDWLVCHEDHGCVDALSQAQLRLPVHADTDGSPPPSPQQETIAQARAALPVASASWQARLAQLDGEYVLRLRCRDAARPDAWPEVRVLAIEGGYLQAGASSNAQPWEEGWDLRIARDVYANDLPSSLHLLLIGPAGWCGEADTRGLAIEAACVSPEALEATWPAWTSTPPEDDPDPNDAPETDD